MDQCFPAKKYPKIFLISSKLITTKPPVFSSDMLNHPRLQFLELHKSQKWEEGAVRGVLSWEQAAALTALSSSSWQDLAPSLPSQPPSRPAPPSTLTVCAHHCSFLHPHCLCPPLLFSHTYPPVFPLSWVDLLQVWVFQHHKVARAFL